ncbi:phage head-tail connector protein [Lactococcus petauri]|uniref:phage head-tail connector protein n=1 Tax=Lactococcus petauri TaxID=1940789 RepID=UPI00254B9846|nr:phage head-tail connector protein [Lactococcus petauri]
MDDDKLNNSINRLKSDLEIDEVKATNLINDAVILVLDYTNQDKMLDSMWLYARQLATITFNRESTEGESSRSEGGVSQSFVEDIPLNIQRGLNRYRLGKVVSFYAPDET